MSRRGVFEPAKIAEAIGNMRKAGLEPLDPYPGAMKAWRSRCTGCGVEVTPKYNNVQQRGTGCRPCGIKKRANARLTPQEDAVAILVSAGLTPLEPFIHSHRPWRSKCDACGDQIAPTLASVKMRGRSCTRCGRKRGGLIRRVPEATAVRSMNEAGLEPLEPYSGLHSPWRSRCLTCHHIGHPALAGVRSGQGGCVPCGIARRTAALRTPADEAVAVMRAAKLEPLEPYPGSNCVPWCCRCIVCDEVGFPVYKTIRKGQGGCIPCGHTRTGLARRVSNEEATAYMLAASLQPLEPYPGSIHAPWRCQCLNCTIEVAPSLGNIRRGSRCRACAKYGFDPSAPAAVYLVISLALHAAKIGVMNRTSPRLDEHRRAGWYPYELDGRPFVWPVEVGRTAERIEDAVLAYWRVGLGAGPAVSSELMPQGGFTETVSLSLIDPYETAMRVVILSDALAPQPISDSLTSD